MSVVQWDKDLFDCFKNPIMCLWSWCIPCGSTCMQAVNAKVINEGHDSSKHCWTAFFCNCCLCYFGAAYNRMKVREKYSIQGNYFIDCLLECFCPCCAVTQEWRQVMDKENGDGDLKIWDYDHKKKGGH